MTMVIIHAVMILKIVNTVDKCCAEVLPARRCLSVPENGQSDHR